jgi:ribulose-bisphosphate carboxylase large chain
MMNKYLSCDWKSKGQKKSKTRLKSRLIRHKGGFSWQGVKTDKYKPPASHWAEVIRRELIGRRGERTKFHVRYFEIAPGGFTSIESHRHEHVVIGIRGRGRCITGKKTNEIGFLDALYICPDEIHRLRNPYKEPFGFFCIVDAKRDRPKAV